MNSWKKLLYLLLLLFCVHADVHAQAAASSFGSQNVTAPPNWLSLDRSYYKKYLDASGVPIVASSTVSDAALKKMKYIVNRMLEKDWHTRQAVVTNLKRVLIIPKDQGMTSLPEYRNFDQTFPIPGSTWNERAQGVGWTAENPYVSCSEADLLNSGAPSDRYTNESICIHEFAHTVFEAGIMKRDNNAYTRVLNLYNDALRRGYITTSMYAGATVHEYWAESVQAFFNSANCYDLATTPVCTNMALYNQDRNMWNEVGKWFYAPYQFTPQMYP